MIGIDIVNIENFSKKADNKFLNKIFTDDELKYAYGKQNFMQTFAGIFAAKEAVIKAKNLNIASILRKRIEIKHTDSKPLAFVNDSLFEGNISISHDVNFAVAVCSLNNDCNIKINSDMKKLLPKRESDTHKGDYGKIAFLGGSLGMAGSVYMASLSAMRSGAGMTFILAPKSISEILQVKVNEQIIKEIDCQNFFYSEKILGQILEKIEDMDSLVIGPGMGRGEDLNKLIGQIIDKVNLDIIIDADGLNALSKDLRILKVRAKNNIILTPHLGEFSRLTGLTIDKIKEDTDHIAKKFAEDNNVVLVLKSNHTIVTDGKKFYKNNIGNPGMATAGSGDVLTGIIGAFSKRLDSFNAAKLGVYVHSLAGDIASLRLGEDSIMATDIISSLPEALKLLR
ncbi:NAD(P)H-hydrate dehydratase [Anaerococcus martiniensis]|uniref:NAD(P)H-hydrate dehydratase n=1 Tax=Anaerococcus sp. WGS1579 TaxID=3366809 RepID=UPI00372D2AE6